MRTAALLLVTVTACATLAGQGSGDQGLPSSGVGPFRPLQDGELSASAIVPYVLSDQRAKFREPSVVGTSDDPGATDVWMYAVGHADHDVIVRSHATDARSFYGDATDKLTHPKDAPATVLSADQPWEGSDLSGPSALRANGQVWLFYAGGGSAADAGAATGGIGVATSGDGLSFTKQGAPVVGTPPGCAAPRAPSVSIFPDGTWHMIYAACGSLYEATSADGTTWTPAGDAVLGPGDGFDALAVDDPMLSWRTTIDGRLQVLVLYAGRAASADGGPPDSAIGVAGRFGPSGALSRQSSPVYSVHLHEGGPALFEWSGGSLLYVHEDDGTLDANNPFPAVAAGVAPVSATLPAPDPFPPGP